MQANGLIASRLFGALVPRCPQNERNALTQPAQRPPASLQEKRPPAQPTPINPRSHELGVLCSVPYSHSCRHPLHSGSGCVSSPFCGRAGLHTARVLQSPTKIASISVPGSGKKEPDRGVDRSRLFSSSLGVQS